MIVRKNLKPAIIIRGAWKSVVYWSLLSGIIWYFYFYQGVTSLALPFGPVAVMGTALSIFLGFRNSSSYERWWEARKIWGGIVNTSRSFARQVITFSNYDHSRLSGDPEITEIRKQLIYRHLAWINALRLSLRAQSGSPDWKQVYSLVNDAEGEELLGAKNKTTQLILSQGKQIADCTHKKIFEDFRYVQLDNTLTELTNLQGQCERIKNTPLPRQYDYFNKVFLQIFIFLLPFSMLETFEKAAYPELIIPFTVLIGFTFYIVEGVGRRIEDPFENKITDTPMSALCRTIEIDLRQMLGETDLPAKLEPVDGFLF